MWGCGETSQNTIDIEKTFEAYKNAILAADGAKSAEIVSQRTLDEYQKYVDWAVHADRETLENLSTVNKMQVLLMKHRIPASEWKEMTGRKAFIYAVDHGWIGKKDTMIVTIGDIRVSGSRATAAAFLKEKKAGNSFHFSREGGSWKLDLIQTLRDTDLLLKEQIKQAGVSENGFIFNILEVLSGRKVPDSIWEPLEVE